MSMRAKLWSMSALAVELAKDRRTVAKALKGVAPDGQRDGHPAWFMASAVLALFEQAQPGELDPAQERARRDRAAAEKLEMENDLFRGTVILIDDAVKEYTERLKILRGRLLNLPSRIVGRVPAEVKQAVFSAAEEEVHRMMAELSDGAKMQRGRASVA